MRQSANCWTPEGQIAEENSKCEWLTSSANGADGCCGLDAIRHPLLLISMFLLAFNSCASCNFKVTLSIASPLHIPDNLHCPNLAPKRRCHRVCHLSWHITRGATHKPKGEFTLGSGSKKLGVHNTPWTPQFLNSGLDPSLKIGFSNYEEYFLEIRLSIFDEKAMPHQRRFIFSTNTCEGS